MSMKNINDAQVCQAVLDARLEDFKRWPYQILSQETGECEKVCFRCMERALDRGYLEFGVSLRTAWLTDKGTELLKPEKESWEKICAMVKQKMDESPKNKEFIFCMPPLMFDKALKEGLIDPETHRFNNSTTKALRVESPKSEKEII